MCAEVEQSERVKEKIQEDVNKLKKQIALRKRKTAEEERSKYLFWILETWIMLFISNECWFETLKHQLG